MPVNSKKKEENEEKCDQQPNDFQTERICRSKEDLPPEIEDLLAKIEVPMTENEFQRVKQLLLDNRDVFSCTGEPLGRTKMVKHPIRTQSETPIKQAVRRPPFHLKEEADKEVQKMLKQDIIEPSESPWASPVVLVRKKDGSLRYCIDYRKLNSVTIKDSYPLPRIDESLDALGGSKYFSTLDLASGYWQIELDEDAKQKSAFCTTSGLYQFKVMPFGLTNAPATFQRLMERVLSSLQWQICLVYIDDIVVFSQTLDDHVSRLQQILRRLKTAGLKLKPKKCFLFQIKVAYLGHIVSEQGIQTDPSKTEKIKNWPIPQCVTDIKSFLGLCSYYRRFVQGFSTIARPLVQLTEKSTQFKWEKEQQIAFDTLKDKLTSAPILAYPQVTGEFILDTDASDTGIGAVLSQVQNGIEKVIAYASKTLSKPEKRYCVTRRELLAVVYFTQYFRHFLLGRKFTVRTDHNSLKWLRKFKNPEGQIARWLEVLETFNFDIQHRPGAKHGNADALSRIPCKQCGSPEHAGEPIHPGRKREVLKEPQEIHPEVGNIQPQQEPHRSQPVVTRKRATKPAQPTSNWLNSEFCLQQIQEEQNKDPSISEAKTWVEKGTRPNFSEISHTGPETKFLWSQFSSLSIQNDLLIRILESPTNMKTQIVVPPSLRDKILHECHNNLTSSHLGQRRTLFRVRQKFVWFGMRKDVEDFIRKCDKCGAYKSVNRKRKGPQRPYPVGYPMERVCLDIAGPYPVTQNGNKYILVVTDCFTKFVEAYPMPNIEARTVATIVVEQFISRYGTPMHIHSDQGTQFEAEMFQVMCDMLGVQKTRTTPFRPQSDGQSERNIRTILSLLAIAVEKQDEWDEHLPYIMMAYRSTPHETTGYTPNYLMFGRETFMPLDIMLPSPSQDQAKLEPGSYASELKTKLSKAYGEARTKLKQSAVRQKRAYDQKTFGEEFQEGDIVWMANLGARKKGVTPKFLPKWKGPYLIVHKFNDILVEVLKSHSKTSIVHTDHLKTYQGRNLPKWLRRAQRQLTI